MDIESLEKMIGQGRDSAMLRLTLAGLLQKKGQNEAALAHLETAVKLDPGYTAAWKALGRVNLDLDLNVAARAAWQTGIEVAEKQGDKQAGKEMAVFLKRLDKAVHSIPGKS